MTHADEPVKREARASSKLRRALDWITLSPRIAEARELERRHADALPFLERADRAVRAADRLLDSPHALDREPDLALELYSQAAHWLGRLANPDAPASGPLAELIVREADTAGWFPPPEEAVVRALAEPFAARAERPPSENERHARDARRWLAVGLERAHERFSPISELRVRRAFRLYPSLGLALALALAAGWHVVRSVHGPDLAASRPWTASSSLYECNPVARQCGGVATAIFFHTREEESPWVEVDLEGVHRIGKVEIDNRRDGAGERAVPLLVEVSTDGKNYRQVAQRTEPFSTWNATFAPTDARYVRLRSPRTTMLHLERISVRR